MSRLPFRSILVVVIVALSSVLLASPAYAEPAITCADLDGAEVWSQESSPRYLGFLGSRYAYASIMNSYGSFGSKYDSNSVRNQYGTYGSPYSMYSANNHLASKPPVIWRGATAIALLTTNTYLAGGVSLASIDANCSLNSSYPIGAPPPPPPPAWFTASDGTYTDSVRVEWAPVAGAIEYVVGATESPDSPIQFFEPTTLTYLFITGLTPGHVYQFGVTAIGPTGNSSFVLDTGYVGIPVPATLTVEISGGGSVTSSPAGIACSSGTCSAQFTPGTSVTLTATPASDSLFNGWNGGGCSGTGACTVMLNSDLAVVASFTLKPTLPETHSLRVALDGNGAGKVSSQPAGIDCGGSCTAEFLASSIVVLAASPASGSVFSGWSGACTGTGSCQIQMEGDRLATALFTKTTAAGEFKQFLPTVKR